jgi:hypothetical protein
MMDYIFLAIIAFGLGYMFLKLIQLYIGCPNPIASMLRQLWHMDELEEQIKKLSSTKKEK